MQILINYRYLVELDISNKQQIAQQNPARVRSSQVHGTTEDVQKLRNWVVQKLGTTVQKQLQQQAWQYDFWYSEDDDEMETIPIEQPPSNKVESSWLQVIDLYIRHQFTWDSTQEIEIIEQEEAGEDVESEDEGKINNNDDEDSNSEEEIINDIF